MVKKAADLQAVKKKNGRYSVKKRGGGYLSGMDKVKFLLDAGLIKTGLPKEAPAEESEAAEA